MLEVKDLQTELMTRWGVVKPVDGVSFVLRRGRTLGIVGESGSGKSITALSIMRLLPDPGARIVGGRVILGGRDLVTLSEAEMSRVRGREIAMILQDPLQALNPVLTIGSQVAETIAIHLRLGSAERWARVIEVLRRMRIPAPEERAKDYPHRLSGGMRQRVVGAIGIAAGPPVIIADEPTTSLDATVQAAYLRLLREIQEEQGVALVLITHDFGIVARMCHDVAVMYAGRIVEMADVETIFNAPLHEYTKALIASIPAHGSATRRFAQIKGQPPLLHELPPGDTFAPRSSLSFDPVAALVRPELVEVGPGHWVQLGPASVARYDEFAHLLTRRPTGRASPGISAVRRLDS